MSAMRHTSEPQRLHLGATQLELISGTPTGITINPSWTHLGDEPAYRPFYEHGTVFSAVKGVARRAFGRVARGSPVPELYERTRFLPWIFNQGDRLPFGDGEFSFAYSEHFLEHLRFDVAHELLLEVWRVLAPGGIFRVVVPDADYRTYERPEPLGYPSTRLPLNHPNRHKVRWNVYMLTTALRSVGFDAIPLVYCDDIGSFLTHDPSVAYGNIDFVADPEFGLSLDYVTRRNSLIVDGFKH